MKRVVDYHLWDPSFQGPLVTIFLAHSTADQHGERMCEHTTASPVLTLTEITLGQDNLLKAMLLDTQILKALLSLCYHFPIAC